jgi:hypothetical protein
MTRVLDTQAYLNTVCDLLRQGEKSVAVPVAGGSMVPFLINGDTVYLELPTTPIRKGDIVLYTRSSGRYILHRVYRVNPDGSFLMAGDAQIELEYVPGMEKICGRVLYARHRGKLNRPGQLRWWAYCHVWRWLLPWRHRLMELREKFRFIK